MASTRRLAGNVIFGVFTNIFRICVQIVMLPLMARLLGPTEMGLYLLAMPLLAFVLQLSEAGLGDSLAREKSDNRLVWSSAFWGLIFLGTGLSVAAYATSFLIGHLAGVPRLPEIILPLCLTLFMVAASVIPHARMLRVGNLVPVSIAEFLATLVGACIAIYLAFNGFGVWSMVAQFIATYFVRMVALNIISPYLPRFEFSFKALVSHAGVGGAIVGGRLIEIVGRLFENARVSKMFGAADLGVFGYANQIGRFLSDAVSNSIWANLYYIALNRPQDEIIRHYVGSQRRFSLIMFPCTAMLVLAMPLLVPQFFGEAWRDSIYPIMILTLSYPFFSMGTYCGAIMFARNQPGLVLLLTVAIAMVRLAVIYLGHPFGVLGITIGVSVVNVVYYIVVVIFVSPVIGNKRSDIFIALIGPLLASIVAAAVCHYVLNGAQTFTWLAISISAGLMGYILTLVIIDFRGLRADIFMFTNMLRRKGMA